MASSAPVDLIRALIADCERDCERFYLLPSLRKIRDELITLGHA